MNAEAGKPTTLPITSAHCLSMMTFLRSNNRDAWAQLVMDMFMRITELEIRERVREEMKPPRPTGMRGARPLGYWPDELRATFDEAPRRNAEESYPRQVIPSAQEVEDNAKREEWQAAARVAAENKGCVPCARVYIETDEWPVECSTGGCSSAVRKS